MGHGDLECSTPVQRNTLGKLLPYNVMVRALEEKKRRKFKAWCKVQRPSTIKGSKSVPSSSAAIETARDVRETSSLLERKHLDKEAKKETKRALGKEKVSDQNSIDFL